MSVSDEEEKKFVIKHVFENAKEDLNEEGKRTEINGPVEEHFGVEWQLRVTFNCDSTPDVSLHCFQSSDVWYVDADLKGFSSGKELDGPDSWEFANSYNRVYFRVDMSYEQYLTCKNLQVEFHVTIDSMSEIEKKTLTFFDDDKAKEHSDVLLKIGEKKFYVNKSYLSFHSTYFDSLFSGNFAESQKSEIELKDVDPKAFQHFLELIYGESLVNDNTVAGILKLADFFDSKTATRRCEEFLLNRSKQPLKFKFHAAIKYSMHDLKLKCMNQIKTKDDFRDLTPENAADFSPEVWKELYDKVVNID